MILRCLSQVVYVLASAMNHSSMQMNHDNHHEHVHHPGHAMVATTMPTSGGGHDHGGGAAGGGHGGHEGHGSMVGGCSYANTLMCSILATH